MREIKCRAKRKDTREWYYFTLEDFQDSGLSSYYSDALDFSMFDKETLGQYIGLKDKNDNEIYEGDIVRQRRFLGWDKQNGERYKDIYGVVRFENGMFTCGIVDYTLIDWNKCEVIGNKWENPELLEEEK